jgi:hypothetical protein
MNVRSNKFGYLLPLVPGTNTVVGMGSDATALLLWLLLKRKRA